MEHKILQAMCDFQGPKGIDYFTADEWSFNLGMKITPQRLTAMTKKGIVEKRQDKAFYGDSRVRYRPVKVVAHIFE